MRILHFSDIHFWQFLPGWDLYYPKRILGFSNLALARRRHFPRELARVVIKEINAQDVDLVLFSGDLTTMSLETEFRDAARAFAPLYEKWGNQLVVIPGNHDRYSPRSVRSKFYERYFPQGAFEEGRRVRSHHFDDNLSVVGFDASRPFMVRSNGLFDEALEDELDVELESQSQSGREVILMGHFPYSYPPGFSGRWDHKLLREGALVDLVSRHEPIAYLHGHKHVRWCLRDPRVPKTLCINAGPAGMRSTLADKHAGWMTFDLLKHGTISAVTKVHLSVDGNLVREQLADIQPDPV